MELIRKNPYRILGILANSKASELHNNKNKIQAFITAEQDVELDYDFPVLGSFERTQVSVDEAISKINLNQDKFISAIFWFIHVSHTDEPAIDYLKDGDPENAIGIWSEIISTGEINSRNYSAYINLGTLILYKSFNNGDLEQELLGNGIKLKLKFLESEFVKDFCLFVADKTYKPSKEETQKLFLKEIERFFVKTNRISQLKYFEILNSISFSAKTIVFKEFVQGPIDDILKSLEVSKGNRKTNPAQALVSGSKFHVDTKESLSILKNILGAQDIKFASISDKIADELLQCGIDYFNKYKNSDTTDPGVSCMKCFKAARNIAVGSIIKERCDDNIKNLQEWIDDKPNRDRQNRIMVDLEKLKSLIDDYGNKRANIATAKQISTAARPNLLNIKSILGAQDELYLAISTRIASDALNMVINEVNITQEAVSRNANDYNGQVVALHMIREKVNEALEVISIIVGMDVLSEFKPRLNTNKSSLIDLKNQIQSATSPRSQTTSSGNCYIATMVYGSYNHPQVLVLRNFRDDVLTNSLVGREFIKFYYKHSPKWVEKLKNKPKCNVIIKATLNGIIKILK